MTWLDRPQQWLNYDRDKRHMIGHIFGPSALGEYWKAVDCQFDPINNRSRVGFRLATADDLAGLVASVKAAS